MIEVKILEIRDTGTCIPVIAIRFGVGRYSGDFDRSQVEKEDRMLRHVGWGESQEVTILTSLHEPSKTFNTHDSPHYKTSLGTWDSALRLTHRDWDSLKHGDVIEAGLESRRVSEPQGSNFP
jgi:hypothetical protein